MESAGLHRAENRKVEVGLCLLDFTVSTTYPKPLSVQENGELEIEGAPIIQFRLVGNNSENTPVKVALIRGGKIIEEFTGQTPLEVCYTDLGFHLIEKSYYRLLASCSESRITSLPIFVVRGTTPIQNEMNSDALSDLPCHIFSYSSQ